MTKKSLSVELESNTVHGTGELFGYKT